MVDLTGTSGLLLLGGALLLAWIVARQGTASSSSKQQTPGLIGRVFGGQKPQPSAPRNGDPVGPPPIIVLPGPGPVPETQGTNGANGQNTDGETDGGKASERAKKAARRRVRQRTQRHRQIRIERQRRAGRLGRGSKGRAPAAALAGQGDDPFPGQSEEAVDRLTDRQNGGDKPPKKLSDKQKRRVTAIGGIV